MLHQGAAEVLQPLVDGATHEWLGESEISLVGENSLVKILFLVVNAKSALKLLEIAILRGPHAFDGVVVLPLGIDEALEHSLALLS